MASRHVKTQGWLGLFVLALCLLTWCAGAQPQTGRLFPQTPARVSAPSGLPGKWMERQPAPGQKNVTAQLSEGESGDGHVSDLAPAYPAAARSLGSPTRAGDSPSLGLAAQSGCAVAGTRPRPPPAA